MNIQPRSMMSLACLCVLAFNFAPGVFAQSDEKSSSAAAKQAADPCLVEQRIILQSLEAAEKGEIEAAYTLLLGGNSVPAGNTSAEVLGSRVAAVAGFLRNIGKPDQAERFACHALKQNPLTMRRNMTVSEREAVIYWRVYIRAEIQGDVYAAKIDLAASDPSEDSPRIKNIRGKVTK